MCIRDRFYMLWGNEMFYMLDVVRKFFVKPKKSKAVDVYENAVNYIKSTLILDFIATFPQVASGLNPQLVFLKILRIYELWLLHYPLEKLVHAVYSKSDKRQIFVVVYACATICRIFMLVHYLAILWIWIGSDSFRDYETGLAPWTFANEDFANYS